MTDHFNGLTPAQAERLAMLAEEAGEVIQIVGKILRHGYESSNPNDRIARTNEQLLRAEITDFLAVFWAMQSEAGRGPTVADLADAWSRKLRYSHHQST